jgi:uncharacterized protein with GYD domain
VIGEPPPGCAEVLRITGGVCAHGGLRIQFTAASAICNKADWACAQLIATPTGEIAMHFCLTGQYTPQALNHMMDSPTTSRLEAAKSLIEAAGGKLISMYSTPADGPGVMVIFDVPDPSAAPAICGVVVASGALHEVKLKRLLTQDEVMQVRQKASQLRGAYKPPGK